MKDYRYSDFDSYKQLKLKLLSKPDKIVVILSPCRSGSTALLNAFAMSGYPSTFQPIKTAIRRFISNDDAPVEIDSSGSTLVIKETLGPYYNSEVHYEPINVLRRAFNIQSISLIALLRRPHECLLSWERSFSGVKGMKYSIDVFNGSYQAVLNTYLWASKSGAMKAVAIRLEDLSRADLLEASLAEVDLSFKIEMIDWKKSEHHKPNAYGFQKPAEPAQFKVAGILDGIKNGAGLNLADSLESPEHTNYNNSIPIHADISPAIDAYNKFLSYCIAKPQ